MGSPQESAKTSISQRILQNHEFGPVGPIRNLTEKWDTINGWKEAMNRSQITAAEWIDAALALGA